MKRDKVKDGRVYVSTNLTQNKTVGNFSIGDKVKITKDGLWKDMVGYISAVTGDDILVGFKHTGIKLREGDFELAPKDARIGETLNA